MEFILSNAIVKEEDFVVKTVEVPDLLTLFKVLEKPRQKLWFVNFCISLVRGLVTGLLALAKVKVMVCQRHLRRPALFAANDSRGILVRDTSQKGSQE